MNLYLVTLRHDVRHLLDVFRLSGYDGGYLRDPNDSTRKGQSNGAQGVKLNQDLPGKSPSPWRDHVRSFFLGIKNSMAIYRNIIPSAGTISAAGAAIGFRPQRSRMISAGRILLEHMLTIYSAL